MLPRSLDPVETRVLGCLMEKQQTTPEYYPMTINALVAACNQKSNREPVMELVEVDVRGALDRLRRDVLVWSSSGSRTERWEHNVDRRLGLDAQTKALVTVLMLRGAQTPGELRARTERMCSWSSLAEVEEALRRLAAPPEPFVVELARRPGQKETRWMHLAGGEDAVRTAAAADPGPDSAGGEHAGALAERVERLEEQVGALADRLQRLLDRLGEA